MPKTYEQLKADQQCVYQAFGMLAGVKDTPSQMGAYVNGEGFDADDDKAVQALAEKYGLTEIEMFLGASWNSEEYNFSENREYILTINGQRGMIDAFTDLHQIVVKSKSDVERIQARFPNEVGHAVYGKTEKNAMEFQVWTDVQGIYKQPKRKAPNNRDFAAPTLVVAYGRTRSD